MRSISSWESRPLSLVMVILFSLAGGLIYRRHVEDAVGVDVEADVDLRAGRGASAGCRARLNFPEEVVVARSCERSPSKTWINTPGWLSA